MATTAFVAGGESLLGGHLVRLDLEVLVLDRIVVRMLVDFVEFPLFDNSLRVPMTLAAAP